MFLRPYRPSDKRSLQVLFFDTVHAVNARDYTPKQLEVWAPTVPDREAWARLDVQHCFVVEFRKTVVGFASLDPVGMVDFLYVHKDFQGRGIATTLLKQLERLARKKKHPALQAEASITARIFFEKVGFMLVSEGKKEVSGLEFHTFLLEKVLFPPSTNIT